MAEAEALSFGDNSDDTLAFISQEAIWLFAFILCADVPQWHLPSATIERRLMLHRAGTVAALIGVVSRAEYCGPDSEAHLTDVAWLAPRVRRHAELVEWAAQRAAVFPVPFGTLFKSFDSLTAFMHVHEATITGFLGSVADKEEWELRAVAQFDDPETLDQLACSAWPEWQSISKGARYMRLCRDKNALFEFGRANATAIVHNLVAEVRPFVSDWSLLRPNRSLELGGGELLARYALLVEKTNIAAVKECVQDIASIASRQHIAMSLAGPWAPFSFRPDLK
ncbi:MAG: GvpL/GvpF family gas vesicle protein [Methylovirgula sp.]